MAAKNVYLGTLLRISPCTPFTVDPFSRTVTGANRGIGLGLVTELVKRSDALVFATARSPENADALNLLRKEHNNLEVLKLEATSEADNGAAAAAVKEKAGRVDYLFANAGGLQARATRNEYSVSGDNELILTLAVRRYMRRPGASAWRSV